MGNITLSGFRAPAMLLMSLKGRSQYDTYDRL